MLDETIVFMDDAKDNLESSIILFENEKYRNSIALSYYAMYLAVKALLSDKNISSVSHRGTITLFFENYVNTGLIDKKLHKCFASTQTLREHAIMVHMIKCAEELINKASELLKLNNDVI